MTVLNANNSQQIVVFRRDGSKLEYPNVTQVTVTATHLNIRFMNQMPPIEDRAALPKDVQRRLRIAVGEAVFALAFIEGFERADIIVRDEMFPITPGNDEPTDGDTPPAPEDETPPGPAPEEPPPPAPEGEGI